MKESILLMIDFEALQIISLSFPIYFDSDFEIDFSFIITASNLVFVHERDSNSRLLTMVSLTTLTTLKKKS